MRLILASQSASRRAMLTAAGVAHEAHPADIDESAIKAEMQAKGEDARAIALALAKAKALAVSKQFPDALVLGGDSIVSVEGRLFDKPVSRENAADHLRAFSGKLMVLDSAAVLAQGGAMVDWSSDDAHLEVRQLSEGFIQSYLDAEWPMVAGCVGCFRMEALGVQLFECVTGSHFTILGMPLLPVLEMLRQQEVLIA